VLLQRVRWARVEIDGETVGEIGPGLLLLAGFAPRDGAAELAWMARKCVELRIFADAEGKMNRSLSESGGQILLVSQFTLYGDARKGRRPSFIDSAEPRLAEQLYDQFGRELAALGVTVAYGRFGAEMQVELCNDGPVTLMLDREADAA
jgi:D-tyrosyl-tRNA(Tyr) deacylase